MDFLNSRLTLGMSLGLGGISRLCKAFGHPERQFQSIHVVGTNGKGSTSFYLSGLLQAHGLRIGFFSSPHLVSVRERIRVQDEPLTEPDLERLLLKIKMVSDQMNLEPSFFETITLAALLYFKEKNIDIAVLEAGLGGRLDTTSIAKGAFTLLTSIGLEHTEILGDSKESILKEKLGILQAGSTLFIGNLSKKLMEQTDEITRFLQVKCVVADSFEISLSVPNLGKHFQENANLALTAARDILGKNWNKDIAKIVLPTRAFPGRMQVLKDSTGKMRYLIDGAHNAHAVKRLTDALQFYFPGKKFTCLFAVLQDKDSDEMVSLLLPFVSKWVLTRTPYTRFQDPSVLKRHFLEKKLPVVSAEMLSESLIEELENSEEPILVTGSLYAIGALIHLLKSKYPELSFFKNLSVTFNENH